MTIGDEPRRGDSPGRRTIRRTQPGRGRVIPAIMPRHLSRSVLCAVAGFATFLAASPAGAADPQPYTVAIAPTGDSALDAALSGSSQLKALRTVAPAGPFALVGRAQGDIARLRTALRSFGFYQGSVAITVNGHALDDPSLPDIIAAIPKGQNALVAITVGKGALFHLRRITLTGPAPPGAVAELGLRTGAPAIAADVLAAQSRLLAALREQGYALARVDPPVATEDRAARVLDVDFNVDAGKRVDLGRISLLGLGGVDEDFVRGRLLVHTGERFAPSKIEAARQDLAAIGVFSGVQARTAAQLDDEGRIPLIFDMQERKRHAVSLNAAYSTDLGGSAGVTWSDRNLFGAAEQLNLAASLTGLGGTAVNGLGYDLKAQFLKPDFLARNQNLDATLEGVKEHLDAYDQTAVIASVALERRFSKRWSGSAGITGEQEEITQEGVTNHYTLLGLPVAARYDSTDLANPLDDPTHGVRLAATVTPTLSFDHRQATFAVLQGNGSTYLDLATVGLARPGRSVIAVRGLIGSAQGATTFELPPDQRFYAGGSATVRGFKYQSIGPLFPDHNPVGGTSIAAGTVEFRQRVWGDFGAVAFVDAGTVGSESTPFTGTTRIGAGAGVRYYTPVGPVRLDVAVPVNKPPGGDSFELYIGLGQAF